VSPRGPDGDLGVCIADDQPGCPACGQQALLSAKVPHGLDNPDGTQTSGHVVVVLCATCHAADPYGGPLITYFQVHGQITAETLDEAACLIRAWADNITIPPVNLDLLEGEFQAWLRGDL
jgi:hypothetical protein